jgi:hypothetical protein
MVAWINLVVDNGTLFELHRNKVWYEIWLVTMCVSGVTITWY